MTSGILLVDKPAGITSHDVVARVRRLAGTRKVGHAGTLDPMATGLLVLGLDSSTRLLTFLVGLDKEYTATIRLGESTDSDDADGTTVAQTDASALSEDDIRSRLAASIGEIDQVPSRISAIKVDGKRAYRLAREGVEVELAPRRITISELEVGEIRREGERLDVDVRVACSSGTYIRSIARDLGEDLGVGGHLTALRRTRVGPFSVADAVPLAEDTDVASTMLAPAAVAERLFPVRRLAPEEAVDLMHGKRVAAGPAAGVSGPIAAVTAGGVLAGIVEARGETLKPVVNFPSDEVNA